MVCKKLKKGACTITRRSCRKPYITKMVKYKSCSIFKKGKVVKIKKKVKKKRKAKKKSTRKRRK